MKDDTLNWLQITAGQGPGECAIAACKLASYIVKEASAHRLDADIIETVSGPVPGSYLSVILRVSGEGSGNFCKSWQGTIQWICQSPLRPAHKRKNWFVSVDSIQQTHESELSIMAKDVRFEAMRASGPGGQHVNKTETAIRATHVPTGLAVVARGERSQHMNKKLALARLGMELARQHAEKQAAGKASEWQKHYELERGNPVRVFAGLKFIEKK